MNDQPPVTELLRRYREGDEAAGHELAPLVYEDLRRQAIALMRGERGGHSLNPTALVNEAWLRLAKSPGAPYEDRRHFMRLSARVMRNVLVDHARRRRERSDDSEALSIVAAPEIAADPADLLDLDDALTRLGGKDAQLVEIVELRYFTGLTLAETGDVLGLTIRQVHRAWGLARAWLVRELRSG